jgi:hypothetical protein
MASVVAVDYSIDVQPLDTALIGQSVVACLRCMARSDSSAILTFDHRSLVIELGKDGLPEEALAFPNRYTVERGGNLVRLSRSGGIEDLRAGEERGRDIDLLPLFPDQVLSVGTIAITYRLEETDPPVRPSPRSVDVTSGPDAVALLIHRLNHHNASVRARAAEVLAMMTAKDFGYDADASLESRNGSISEWRSWWDVEGSLMPWNFEADGATFGQVSAQPPIGARGARLGGIASPEA